MIDPNELQRQIESSLSKIERQKVETKEGRVFIPIQSVTECFDFNTIQEYDMAFGKKKKFRIPRKLKKKLK